MDCNRDCFNCKYDDCHNNKMSAAERRAIKKRDERYFYTGKVVRAKPTRAKRLHLITY